MKDSEYSIVSALTRLRCAWESLRQVFIYGDDEAKATAERLANEMYALIQHMEAKVEEIEIEPDSPS